MKAACSTAGFTKMPLEDALQNIRELGFEFVDLLMMENWAHINPSELVSDPISKAKQTAEMLKANGLKAIGINANLSSPLNITDPGRQVDNLAQLKALAIFADNIGVHVIVLQPGPVDPGRGLEKSQEASINALRDMVKIAKEHGKELAIETHVNSVAEEYKDALKMVKSVPGLKIAYDPSHFVMKELNLADSEPMMEHTAHVHLRNAVVGNFQAEMDEGILDFDWVFDALERHNYDGYISVEYIDSREDYDIRKQITKLKKVIEEAGAMENSLSRDVQMQFMRPGQLEAAIRKFPVVYVPFGLIEWHGRHLPLGNDALKAHAILVKCAEQFGGVVYPPQWLHNGFDQDHLVPIYAQLFQRLKNTGFRVIIGVSGHNVQGQIDMINEALKPVTADGTVAGVGIWEITLSWCEESNTDHAAKWETSNMMFFYPDRVDISELGDEEIVLDMSAPWGIGGLDPREHASAEVGRRNVELASKAIGEKARELLNSLPPEHRAFGIEKIEPGHWWLV